MEDLLKELRSVADAGYYSVALFASLALPDICAAMESEDGTATGAKYKIWFDKWVAPKYISNNGGAAYLSGETCYAYRCGLLHQGTSMHKKLGYSRIIFLEPGPFKIHNCIMSGAYALNIPCFVQDISTSIRAWLKTVEGTNPFDEHFKMFMKRHKGGLAPYVNGVDVYS